MQEPNFFIALFLTVFVLIYSYGIAKVFKIQLTPVKFESIDGLRGYLAFFVVLHHACIYYYYLPSDGWGLPPQHLYSQFGQTSVSLFFMITGFLFFNKLIEAREKGMDWQYYIVSRFMRLYPLYLCALVVMLFLVYMMSGFHRMDKYNDLFLQGTQWLFFGVINTPDVNGYHKTGDIINVLWSIRYEWLFYFSLPVIGLVFLKKRPNVFFVLVCALVTYIIFISGDIKYHHFLSFISGLVAAISIKYEKLKSLATHWLSSVIVISCLVCIVIFYHNAEESYIPLALTTIVFILIANGNSIFGLLVNKASRFFGQISYSLYLLHSLLYFITFRVVICFDVASTYTLYEYWAVIFGVCTVLIPLCYFTYYKIELPSYLASSKISSWIKNRLGL